MRLSVFRSPNHTYLTVVEEVIFVLFFLFVAPSCSATMASTEPVRQTITTAAMIIRIGTRPSKLATIQAQAVAEHLKRHHPLLEPIIVPIHASGDISGAASGGVGVVQDNAPLAMRNVDFTTALDQAVQEGTIDVAVHSLKDIPPDHRWPSGKVLSIHCPLPREDSADVLIGPYRVLDELPPGSKVGTSSIRRQAQLLAKCRTNNIQVVNLRGNVEARMDALQQGAVDALILAQSGLHRLHLDKNNNEDNEDSNRRGSPKFFQTNIPSQDMLPGACQGIVAAVVLKHGIYDDTAFWKANIDATVMASAERAFLNCLDESSSRQWKGRPPLAGLFTVSSTLSTREDSILEKNEVWLFQGLLARADGTKVLTAQQSTMVPHQQYDIAQNMTLSSSKEIAATLGNDVGCDLLQQAGPQFLN